jgi:Ca-activated chloride channel family protein
MTHVLNPRRFGLALFVGLMLAACGQNPPQTSTPEPRKGLDAPSSPKLEEPAPIAVPPVARAPISAPMPAPAMARSSVAPTLSMVMPTAMPIPVAQPSTARYAAFEDRPWQRVAEAPVSTFSASVDTGSYANVRRFLNRGALPPRDAVRVEELVNYFGYDYAAPAANAATPFAVDARLVASPWQPERGLLRIAIKGQDLAKQSLPPANLIFLVDVSGSMGPQDRLPLVRSALHLLTNQLRAQDRVGIVSYASGTRVVLEATPGDRKDAIHAAIDTLQAGGGTYGEAGIRLAYTQARAGFINGGINRVLLATDGDLNIGVTNADELKTLVEGERKHGVGLTTLGVGDSNFNEALMKKLADVGDGSYHYLDTLQEAHKVLVNEMTSTLAVIAQDLKLQIEFNPSLVGEYRLLGYELNNLTREQFNDDKADAGDIGAGHTVTALYEIIPTGAKGTVDPLRYKPTKPPLRAEPHANELAWLKLRYKPPGQADSKLVELPITRASAWPALDKADADLRFAVAVAAWGQWLRGSTQIGDYGPAQIAALAHDARGADRYGHRAEFERLVELSAGLKR